MELKLRSLRPSDEVEISGLIADWGERPGFHWPAAHIRGELTRARGLGAWADGVLQAFVCWREAGGENEITVLATRLQSGRRGVMRELLASAIGASRHRWLLEVHEGNLPALNLYRFLGFEEIGRRTRYYRDGGAAVIMERKPLKPL